MILGLPNFKKKLLICQFILSIIEVTSIDENINVNRSELSSPNRWDNSYLTEILSIGGNCLLRLFPVNLGEFIANTRRDISDWVVGLENIADSFEASAYWLDIDVKGDMPPSCD
jgi:hypothetical protein